MVDCHTASWPQIHQLLEFCWTHYASAAAAPGYVRICGSSAAAAVSGTSAIGKFPDGTKFTAGGETTFISVNIDSGVCVGTYHVSSL